MVADRIERLRQLLLLLSILALCHYCVMHTSQLGSDQWQWIIGSVLAAPTDQLLVYVTVITALFNRRAIYSDEVRNLVGFVAGAGEPSTFDDVSSPYMR